MDKLCNVHEIVFGSIFLRSIRFIFEVGVFENDGNAVADGGERSDGAETESFEKSSPFVRNLENALAKLLRNAESYVSA